MASLDFKTFFEIGKVSGGCYCYWFCFVFVDFVSDRDQTQGLTKLPQSHTPSPSFAVSGSLFLIDFLADFRVLVGALHGNKRLLFG